MRNRWGEVPGYGLRAKVRVRVRDRGRGRGAGLRWGAR